MEMYLLQKAIVCWANPLSFNYRKGDYTVPTSFIYAPPVTEREV